MNVLASASYTNEVSPEYLRSLDRPYFSEQQIAQFDEQAQAAIRQQQAYVDSHPATAIFRFATEGGRTRNGGEIQQATSPLEFTLDNGQKVRVARKGDCVVYADGSTAQIVTTAGQENSYLVLVGSRLENGDEIITTLQDIGLFVAREGVSMGEDFLPSVEGEKNDE